MRRNKSGISALSEDHYAFCSAFARTNNAEGSAAYAGFHPKSGFYLLRNQNVLSQIEKCKQELAERAEKKADKAFELEREYVNVKVVHFLETLQTHERRGDADRVKTLEIAARCTGQIQPMRIVNHNQAGATANAVATAKEVYKSKWMIQNEEKMRLQLESENTTPSQ